MSFPPLIVCLVGRGKGKGEGDRPADGWTIGLADGRTNGPVQLVISSFPLCWLIELRSDGEFGIFSLQRTVDEI